MFFNEMKGYILSNGIFKNSPARGPEAENIFMEF